MLQILLVFKYSNSKVYRLIANMALWPLLFLYIICCFPCRLSCQYLPESCFRSCEVNVCNSECILPNQPPNGKYAVIGTAQGATPTPGSRVRNSTVLYFTCNSGYRPIAASTAICLESKWVTDFRYCEKIKECVFPQLPPNGGYNIVGSPNQPNPGTEAKEWTALTYFCDSSFTLVDQVTAVCQSGQWSSNPPYCRNSKTVTCVLPEQPQNGQYTIAGSSIAPVPGQTVSDSTALSFGCSANFKLTGESVVSCSGGSWLRTFPTCVGAGKSCTLPKQPRNGQYAVVGSLIDPIAGQSVPDLTVLYFYCYSTFELSGGGVAVCSQGLWLNGIPECNVNWQCSLPLFPGNGTYMLLGSDDSVLPGFDVSEKETIQFSCSPQFQLVGTEYSTCYKGSWTSAPPVCVERNGCVVPHAPFKGSLSLVGSTNSPIAGSVVGENQVLIFTCEPGYKLYGNESVTCSEGVWTAKVPLCTDGVIF